MVLPIGDGIRTTWDSMFTVIEHLPLPPCGHRPPNPKALSSSPFRRSHRHIIDVRGIPVSLINGSLMGLED